MSIESITAVEESNRWAMAQQAQQVAIERRMQAGQESNIAVGNNAVNVTTQASHAPITLAQAAQMQIYTQAGVLASLAAANSSHGDFGSSYRNSTEIKPVGATEGATVNTKA